ncbi:MAG: hypothetical protein QOE99_3098 [Actinomycetota bacterium]|nr:hypothetical protein [Actinomycetota bacterium]
MISAGDVVGLIFAIAFVVLVLFLGLVLLKLGKVLGETQKLVAGITDKTVPLLGEVTGTVTHVNEELVRVDAITANVQSMTGNISALTSLFAATLGSPVVKVAAFSYGVRRAATKRQHGEIEKRIKTEMKAAKRK